MKIYTSLDKNQPLPLYTAQEVYALDAAAIAAGTPGLQLMRRAAQAALELLITLYSEEIKRGICVYCGTGKNGGDGYVLAALAKARGLPVEVIALTAAEKLSGEPLAAYQFAQESGVVIHAWQKFTAPVQGVIVDALLGIGLEGAPRAEFAAAIHQINSLQLPVLAIDIPSGLNANTGAAAAEVVNAHSTISFIAIKRGLVTGRGPDVCGEIYLNDLSITENILQSVQPKQFGLNLNSLKRFLPKRKADAHKGTFGHVLIIGGDHGMGGAVIMAAEAAARSGAGLVSVATRAEHVAPLLTRHPEIMVRAVNGVEDLNPLLERATVLVVGPGLGKSDWAQQLFTQALTRNLPMVLDADALNLVSESKVKINTKRDNIILTPHPAEAARLLNSTTLEINSNRFESAKSIQQKFGGAVILKGAGSLVVSDSEQIGVVVDGNPGMATGGMGDVLSGILGALLAQALNAQQAAELGAVAHACAGDLVAQENGERGLLATDLIGKIQAVLN